MVGQRVAWLMEHLGLGLEGVLGKVCFPLGLGNCSMLISAGFAIGENKAILAALIGSFDFKPVPGTDPDDISILWRITARIIGGYDVQTTVVEGW